jgi:hypothetical protein
MSADLKALFPTPRQPESRLQLLAQEWEATATNLRASPAEVTQAAYVFFTYACDYARADPRDMFLQMLELNRGRIDP